MGHETHSPVIAYADDVMIFVTNPTDFHTISQAIRRCEKATSAQLNPHKSKALAIGQWTEPAPTLGILLHERVEILGVSFGHTNALTTQGSWPRVINTVHAQAKQSYTRNLNLAQRVHYVKLHLFTKLWFLAQIIQLTRQHAQEITAIATWFIWRGSIFKVPVTTLQRPKWEGGWDLPHIETKCKTLLYNHLQLTSVKPCTALSVIMRKWELDGPISNPPAAHSLPTAQKYLQQFAIDMAYVSPQQQCESRKAYKRRIYPAPHGEKNGANPSGVRIINK
jgi:hypothetical protein